MHVAVCTAVPPTVVAGCQAKTGSKSNYENDQYSRRSGEQQHQVESSWPAPHRQNQSWSSNSWSGGWQGQGWQPHPDQWPSAPEADDDDGNKGGKGADAGKGGADAGKGGGDAAKGKGAKGKNMNAAR
jgi:hypothetical protein